MTPAAWFSSLRSPLRALLRSLPRGSIAAWLLLPLAMPVDALDSNVPLKQLRHTVWLAKDGLPSDGMTAFEQTTDGYIWIATYGGLYQFDGQSFERVILPRDPKLRSTSAYSLYATRDGGLWIGFTFGGLGFLRDGKLRMYDGNDGIPPECSRDHRGTVGSHVGGNVCGSRATGSIRQVGTGQLSPFGNHRLQAVRGRRGVDMGVCSGRRVSKGTEPRLLRVRRASCENGQQDDGALRPRRFSLGRRQRLGATAHPTIKAA